MKKAYQEYLDRWKLVAEVEKGEIRKAPFELLLQQTFSIWDLAKSFGFSAHDTPPNPLWNQLQRKFKDKNV